MAKIAEPDVKDGIDYWNTQPASLDGVLGGFGSGSLPRIDALGSRQFLLSLIPELCTVPSAIRPLAPPHPHRTRALDVGAGIGRVTADVLLYLVSDVVLLEPVDNFVQEALACARASADERPPRLRWKGIADKSKSVTFLQGTLQAFDPAFPQSHAKRLDRLGYEPETDDENSGFDVIWCQWCLGHLSDRDLVDFLKRSQRALRGRETGTGRSAIVVKENLCSDAPDGGARTVFDEEDSSLTRSDKAWKLIFAHAGLRLVRETVQLGLPPGLYTVKAYALR